MYFLIPVLIVLVFSSCKSGFTDHSNDIKVIEDLLQQERKAHFEKDADLFTSEFADSMISVNAGKVSVSAPEKRKKGIAGYFASTEFIKWDDVAKPVIRISDDGSMAYAVVQKLVITSEKDSTGKAIVDTTQYAWVSIYKKQGQEWKVDCNVSTNKE